MLMASTGEKTYAVKLYNHFGFVDDSNVVGVAVFDHFQVLILSFWLTKINSMIHHELEMKYPQVFLGY